VGTAAARVLVVFIVLHLLNPCSAMGGSSMRLVEVGGAVASFDDRLSQTPQSEIHRDEFE